MHRIWELVTEFLSPQKGTYIFIMCFAFPSIKGKSYEKVSDALLPL